MRLPTSWTAASCARRWRPTWGRSARQACGAPTPSSRVERPSARSCWRWARPISKPAAGPGARTARAGMGRRLLRRGLGAATPALGWAQGATLLGCRERCLFGLELRLLLGDQLVPLGSLLAQAAQHAARACRNEPSDDDVLLEPLEGVGLTVDGGVGQHAGGLLEGGSRDEAARLQRSLGDAEQHGLCAGRPLAGLLRSQVLFVELDPVELLALEELGLAGVLHLHLLQHLADDDLDVLVVDGHALQPIDVLDLVDQVVGKLLHSFDGEDVVGGRMAIIDKVALLDAVAVLHSQVLAARDQVLLGLGVLIVRFDEDALLILVILAELDGARDLGDDRVVLRPPRLEQLRHAR